MRFSRAAAIIDRDADDADVTQITDLNAEIVDSNFDVLIEEKRRGMEVTELAAGPQQAMLVLNQLLEQNRDENNIVYVLSDFREKEWKSPSELLTLLRETEGTTTDIQFVACVDKRRSNLTLTELQPEPGTRAAGVPLFVNVSVRNNGDESSTEGTGQDTNAILRPSGRRFERTRRGCSQARRTADRPDRRNPCRRDSDAPRAGFLPATRAAGRRSCASGRCRCDRQSAVVRRECCRRRPSLGD